MSCTVQFGGVTIILLRGQNHLDPVPMVQQLKDKHHHPGAGRTTIYDLGPAGAERFTCDVVCADRSTYLAFAAKQSGSHSFSSYSDPDLDGTWSMEITQDSVVKNTREGTHRMTCEFWRV